MSTWPGHGTQVCVQTTTSLGEAGKVLFRRDSHLNQGTPSQTGRPPAVEGLRRKDRGPQGRAGSALRCLRTHDACGTRGPINLRPRIAALQPGREPALRTPACMSLALAPHNVHTCRTCVRTQAHARTHTQTHTHMHAHTDAHSQTHAGTHMHMHTTRTDAHGHMDTHARSRAQMHTCTHTHTHTHFRPIVRQHVAPLTVLVTFPVLAAAGVWFHAIVWFRSFQTCSGLRCDPECDRSARLAGTRESRASAAVGCEVPCASPGPVARRVLVDCRPGWSLRPRECPRPSGSPSGPCSVCRIYASASALSARVLTVVIAELLPLSCVMTGFVSRHRFR